MPSVKVEHATNLSASETFKRISAILSNDSDLKKIDSKYKAQFDAQSRSGVAEGSMFKAKMAVRDQGTGAVVEITVDLPFHLALAKGMVQKTLQKKLEQALS